MEIDDVERLNWDPDYTSLGITARSLHVLGKNCRSPFHGLSTQEVVKVLTACKAEYARTPKFSRRRGITSEGIVIFRQHKQQTHVHIPLSGVVVAFEALPIDRETENPHYKILEPLLDKPITMDTLFRHFDYVTSICPGEVAGLSGLFLSFLKYLDKHEDLFPKSYSERRKALVSTQLFEFAGRWLLSGFVSNNAKIVRIDINNLLECMLKVNPTEKKSKWSQLVGEKAELRPSAVIRRCCEETAIRTAQQRFRASLVAKGKRDQVMAMHLYEYFGRKRRNRVSGTNQMIAWYLNCRNADDVPKIISKFDPQTLSKVEGKQVRYSFDAERLLKYHLKYLKKLDRKCK